MQRSRRSMLLAMQACRFLRLQLSPSLWAKWNGKPEEVLREFCRHADLLFGNHRDASLLLGRDFDVWVRRAAGSRRSPIRRLPQSSVIASTARHVRHVDSHLVSARLDTREHAFQTTRWKYRASSTGLGGDAFAAGILHGLICGLDGTAIV